MVFDILNFAFISESIQAITTTIIAINNETHGKRGTQSESEKRVPDAAIN